MQNFLEHSCSSLAVLEVPCWPETGSDLSVWLWLLDCRCLPWSTPLARFRGCHINPAVTLGVFLAKKIRARAAALYVVAQVTGGIVGAALILIVARGGPHGYSAAVSGLGANGFGLHSPAGYSMSSAFLVEFLLTFLLVFTVLGTTDIKSPVGFAGIAIGLVLTLIHLVGIPITNTSVNPARSIGPALFVGGWALSQLWLFIVAPLMGAAAAAVSYTAIRGPEVLLTTTRAVSSLTSEQSTREKTSLESGK